MSIIPGQEKEHRQQSARGGGEKRGRELEILPVRAEKKKRKKVQSQNAAGEGGENHSETQHGLKEGKILGGGGGGGLEEPRALCIVKSRERKKGKRMARDLHPPASSRRRIKKEGEKKRGRENDIHKNSPKNDQTLPSLPHKKKKRKRKRN